MPESKSPAQHRADSRRRSIRKAHTETAREVFSRLTPGAEIVVLTHGQFSLLDALEVLLDTTGPASVTVSTWSAAGAFFSLPPGDFGADLPRITPPSVVDMGRSVATGP